jgi:hypothetical protein
VYLFQAIIAIGFFVVLLSGMGCFGAYYERKWILIIYAIVLFLLLVAELALGVAIFLQRDHASEYVSEAWGSLPNPVRVRVQNQFDCCGLLTFNDTLAGLPCPSTSFVNSTSAAFPATAVTPPSSSSGNSSSTSSVSNSSSTAISAPASAGLGCLPKLLASARSVTDTFGIVVIVFASCQLAATILVVVLLVKLKHLREQAEKHAGVSPIS